MSVVGFVPAVVTAQVVGSVVIDPTYGLMLDGIVTAAARAVAAGGSRPSGIDGGLRDANPVDYDLPFDRCHEPGTGEWHWAAGGAWLPEQQKIPVESRSQVRWLTSRLNVSRARAAAWTVPANALGSRGRYRPVRRPIVAQVASLVSWRVIADIDRLRGLLAVVPAVGARRGSGEGQVVEWRVDSVAAKEGDAVGGVRSWVHCAPSGGLSRPVPVGCATALGVGFCEMRGGLRPPVFHPSRQRVLAFPA